MATPLFQRLEEFQRDLHRALKEYPRHVRGGYTDLICGMATQLDLQVLRATRSPRCRVEALQQADELKAGLDRLLCTSREFRYLAPKHHQRLMALLGEIGAMIGSWIKKTGHTNNTGNTGPATRVFGRSQPQRSDES